MEDAPELVELSLIGVTFLDIVSRSARLLLARQRHFVTSARRGAWRRCRPALACSRVEIGRRSSLQRYFTRGCNDFGQVCD